MKTLYYVLLTIIFCGAVAQIVWALRVIPPAPAGIIHGATSTNELHDGPPPINFDEAYQRYLEKAVREKYADRLPLEEARLQQTLARLKELLEQQRRMIEEARRP